MNRGGTFRRQNVDFTFRGQLIVLCALFAVGVLLGWRLYGNIAQQSSQQLQEYLTGYSELMADTGAAPTSLLSALFLYFRYPLLIFIFGFSALGIVLIPLLCVAEGFFLSFAVTSFVVSMGREGVLLALAALGVRCLFTLPCILFLALQAMDAAQQIGKQGTVGHRKNRAIYEPVYFLRFGACVLILLLGVVLEVTLVPKLFQLALTAIS